MIEHIRITDADELSARCETLKLEPVIAVDLEADSMHHFKEKVCLIQIADSTGSFLVDPLAVKDLSSLKPVFESEAIIKVFHGADFDIRSLDRDFNIRVNNLFDTEIACRLLGIQKRSLAALIERYFDRKIDKRFQKTDWSIRPLTDEMIDYSLTDVAYLIQLYQILSKELINAERYTWAQEEFEIQTAVRAEPDNGEPLFMKFKGAGKMGRRTLAVLEELLQLRRQLSEIKDRPFFKIIGTEPIKKLAMTKPTTMERLLELKILSRKQIDMYGEACIKAIRQGLAVNESDLPVYPRKKPPKTSPDVPERIKALKAMRTDLSSRIGIEPGFLISNATISTIAADPPSSMNDLKSINGFRNWQIDVFGKIVLSVLAN